MFRPIAVLTTLAATCAAATALAAPAQAAPPRSAEAFVRAFERAAVVVERQSVGLADRVEAYYAPCEKLTKADGDAAPVEDVFALLAAGSLHEIVIEPLLPALAQLSRELDAIPTSDRALRKGRTDWRVSYDTFLRFPAVDDACGKLLRWRDAGWAPAARPEVPPNPLDLIFAADDGASQERLDRAERRLRQLGISRERAALVQGDGLIEPLDDALAGLPDR